MDEKESIPEAPNTPVSDKGDTADSEKPSIESVQEMVAGGAPNVNFDNELEINATQLETESELRNHVDHKVSADMPLSTAKEVDHDMSVDEPMSSAKNADDHPDEMKIETQSEAKESKASQENEALTLESTEENTAEQNEVGLSKEQERSIDIKEPSKDAQESTKENELVQSVDENITTKEEASEETDTQDKTDQEEINQQDGIKQSEDLLKIADDKKEDEVGRPEFETAPNVSLDESQEDHTQALDPFDALLKDRSDPVPDTSTSSVNVGANADDDDDDHHADADPVEADAHDEEDHHQEEDTGVAELVEGADEEVCLLPDTEREISEADKAEAEKVLAEKRKQAEAAALAVEPKQENEAVDQLQPEETFNNEEAEEPAEPDPATDDASHENGGDKENENEDAAEAVEPEIHNKIQEISPAEGTCVQCVRFGYDIRQFCNSGCLEEFKKGLKICCYCQKDISSGHQGFLAPVGDKGQFKDFCSQVCMEKFDHMSKNPVPQPVWAKCAVCSLEKATTIEVEISEDSYQRLCSDPCFAAFKFVNNIFPDQCRWCKKYFERKQSKCFTIYDGATPQCFCSKSCMNVFISNSRHIVPCNWCKVKKYNFDMIKRMQSNGQAVMMCSLNCLNLYQVSINAVSSRKTKCDMCKRTSLAQYHLTMSDATVRNFCTYQCVMQFQGQYSKHAPGGNWLPGESIDQQKAVPTGAPRRNYSGSGGKNNSSQKNQQRSGLPIISNVQSLAAPPPLMPAVTRGKSKRLNQQPPPEPEPPAVPKTPPPPPKPPTPPPPPPPKVFNHVIVKTLPPHEVANKGTMSKPMTQSKGVSCRPHPCTKECQTDPSLERRVLIPVPVPIYVPVPCAMWSLPFPVPIPIPIPIPTPVFIPTTRNSAKGIMKEINKIHDKMPTDPFEAELLMMAEMVAGDKKKDQSDSETEDENEEGFSPVGGMDGNNAFGEDMLQMALKMATEYEDQPVDLESAMTANTITPSSHPGMPGLEGEGMHHHHMMVLEQQRAVAALRASSAAAVPRKRTAPPPAATRTSASRTKRSRRAEPPPPPQPEPPREPVEKPDANMCLKYTFGVNAWKQWVMTKNAEIEKSSIRRKPFKSEILQLTADELNYSLCLFVKEVRKPNGSEYAPDTIYYLVLGIQQYLFENGRIDNIFTDPYYEKFTDCLDEVARKFSVLYNDSQYIVTRVEEEHLWESKQLGAHSPHVLLSTLMFFNTKHFNLVTVEEHMQLSFSHIMKHWKRNPNQPGQAKIPGSRNVLLRFYPPQSALEANSRKKKVYEQQENEENPLRCPVKLYEFYISKCPESVRTRNDVFYLQPERSCVPDSPVWYSTQPLSRQALAKMLHRVKMVKEINIALLTS
ncbi:zinc finger MYM-type protein 4 isoform X2 [Hyposmocoma kahamanoa]|uniref:zinc finger MYM-type protein 4 isoform X2 n=1 Tax=Hyposmocoma kahamanoa TaxID=1477025 RepID=UPI000E6DA3D4|nr:zinc finger MYM-type protein 4 isoform X2 [Hyposmocoma kahamanoa]